MKIYRLGITMFLCLCSCVTATQNTNDSPIIPEPSPTVTVSASKEPTVIITSSPSIDPTPQTTVSNSPTVKRNISLISIISDNKTIMSEAKFETYQNNFYNYQLLSYNILRNENQKFNASFTEDNQVKTQDIVWSSSNPEIATVDQSGLVSATDKNSDKDLIGSTVIRAFVKGSPEINTYFFVKLYNQLEIDATREYGKCPGITRKVTIDRYEQLYISGDSFDLRERGNAYGKVYDKNKNLLDGITLNGKVFNNKSVTWEAERQTTKEGNYILRSAPTCIELLITASKEGYITQERIITVTPYTNLSKPNINEYNFGGDNIYESKYALEKIEN